ncbi:hypothetical protein [Bartonella sp. AP72JLCBS]|uniref:hypothetical protein n=1 Tax=Bartonella sp. AP72JLCBS TaxID=3243502 RepID=UPI0035D06660
MAKYIFDNHKEKVREHVFISKKEYHSFVSLKVSKFIDNFFRSLNGEKIIVGVSGGGDSNTLLQSLIKVRIPKDFLVPVRVLGIQNWNTREAKRAKTGNFAPMLVKIASCSFRRSWSIIRCSRDRLSGNFSKSVS